LPEVREADRDISPTPETKLVLELVGEVEALKFIKVDPRCTGQVQVDPLNHRLTMSSGQAAPDHHLWCQTSTPMADGGQHVGTCWRVAGVLLQQFDMEDIMKTGARRQLDAVGDLTDALGDHERPVVLGSQLAAPLDIEGCHRAVKEVQPDLVTDGELQELLFAIIKRPV
jgi:hypothetical protein